MRRTQPLFHLKSEVGYICLELRKALLIMAEPEEAENRIEVRRI